MSRALADSHTVMPPICSRPVFLLASFRSGAHALAYALAQHSELGCVGSSQILDTLLSSDAQGETSLLDRMFPSDGQSVLPRWNHMHGVDRAELLAYLGLGLNALWTRRHPGKRWIDKSPRYVRIAPLLAALFPDALFLHLVRDGRRVVHSMLHYLDRFDAPRRAELIQSGEGRWPWATDLREACRAWRETVEAGYAFADKYSSRCLTVCNESLVADPDHGFAAIYRFLQVPVEAAPVACFRTHRLCSSFREDSPPHPLEPTSLRAGLTAEQASFLVEPVGYQDTQPWTEWTAEQKRIFAEEAGETLVRWGFAQRAELAMWGNLALPSVPHRSSPDAVTPSEAVSDHLLRQIRVIARHVLPPGCRVLVANHGHAGLLELSDCTALPFPEGPPLAELEAQRYAGAAFLLVPRSAWNWLESQKELRLHLMSHCDRRWTDENCTIFHLTPRSPTAPASAFIRGPEIVAESTTPESSKPQTSDENVSRPPALPARPTLCSQPLFILGSPRSGSHGLAHALARHSQLTTHGESEFLLHLLRDNRIDKILAALNRPTLPVWTALADTSRPDFLAHLGLGVNALFTSRNPDKRWIDKTPAYIFIAEQLAEMFPDARFLHLLRDGRRVVHSMIHFLDRFAQTQRAALVAGGQVADWARDFRAACVFWRRSLKAGMEFAARHPRRCLTIRNEQLVANPRAEFAGIFDFLGLAPQEAVTTFFGSVRINSSFRAGDAELPSVEQLARPAREWDESQRRFFVEPVPYQDTEPWQGWTPEQKKIFAYEAGDAMLRGGFAGAEEIRSWGAIRSWEEEAGIQKTSAVKVVVDPMVREIRRVVDAALAPLARVLLVSQGNPQLLELGGRLVHPFPDSIAGDEINDGAKAVQELLALQERGYEFLLVPSGAKEWLERCEELKRHLETRHFLYWWDERCLIYRLAVGVFFEQPVANGGSL
jgi:hypothetical protein